MEREGWKEREKRGREGERGEGEREGERGEREREREAEPSAAESQ